jgi:Subtilase family
VRGSVAQAPRLCPGARVSRPALLRTGASANPATGVGARATAAGAGFDGNGGGGGESLLGEPGTPYDEQTEWTLVPFLDPRTGQTYDIVDGRVTIAFKNPPLLPVMDPNYYDVERQSSDMSYSVPTPDPGSDPAIAAFIAAENLSVVSTWKWVKSIGAILPPGQTVLDAVTNWPLEYPGIIEAVDPDFISEGAVDEPTVPPNDDQWDQQWSVTWADYSPSDPEDPESPPVSAFPIDVVYAWGTGEMDNPEYRYYNGVAVEVAILDTGVDYDNGSLLNHDLLDNSDSHGCNVGEDKLRATTFNQRVDEGGEPWEWILNKNAWCAWALGHGTNVAGIISAKTDNDNDPDLPTKDIAGIAYNPMYFPFAIKAFGYAAKPGVPYFDSWAIKNAYTALACVKGVLDEKKEYYSYSVFPFRNIEVANCSYGSPVFDETEYRMLLPLSRSILFVASTGNAGSSTQNTWPARLGSALSTASYTKQGSRSTFSNHAPDTDIAAPGSGIWTCDMVGTNSSGQRLGSTNNPWFSFSGTSAAAPHVAAIAILVSCKYEPNLIPYYVKERILDFQKTSPPLTGFSGITKHPDAYEALYGTY